MGKNAGRKVIRKYIEEGRLAGKTDQDIYNELPCELADKHTVAVMISSTATPAAKNAYKAYNRVLVGLYALLILTCAIVPFNMFIVAIALFSAWLLVETARYNGTVYRIGGVVVFSQALFYTLNIELSVAMILILVLAAIILNLSLYLGYKMFPSYKLFGLRRNEKGEYLFW